jgi:Zn finger protein HypA/HybF involved in hydrogenase expression
MTEHFEPLQIEFQCQCCKTKFLARVRVAKWCPECRKKVRLKQSQEWNREKRAARRKT